MDRLAICLISSFVTVIGIVVSAPVLSSTFGAAGVAETMRRSHPAVRQTLFDLLRPEQVVNCELKRFGESHDGGYLMCANLLGDVRAGYSYGISGYDKWGCDISSRLSLPVHQYDCFDTRQPVCLGGNTLFHAECVGEVTKIDDGRPFDTMERQFIRNGDGAKRLVVKMDVEAAEWSALLNASDETLNRIDQLSVEFHHIHERRFVDVVARLRRFFHVAHLHFNNWTCSEGLDPFPAWAYEVLFVNKRLAVVDSASPPALIHPEDAPNNPALPDCQLEAR